MHRSAIIASAAIAALATGAVAASQAATGTGLRTVSVFERGEQVKLTTSPATLKSSGPGFGDELAFHARLTTARGTTAGHLYGSGTFANRNGQAVITGVYALRGGDLDIIVSAKPGYHKAFGAIVGGTGAYAGAHGTVVSVALPNGDFKDTITLLR